MNNHGKQQIRALGFPNITGKSAQITTQSINVMESVGQRGSLQGLSFSMRKIIYAIFKFQHTAFSQARQEETLQVDSKV